MVPTAGAATSATLYYEHSYNLLGGHQLNFLHLIRQVNVFLNIQNQHALEETFWHDLDAMRAAFAAAVVAILPDVDMLVDPPSTRGYHRPFLSSFKQTYNVPCLMLQKTRLPAAPVAALGMTPNQANVPSANRQTILIVDDVYATGATAARVIDFLRKFPLPEDVQFHIAAPLLIPAAIQKASAANAIRKGDPPQPDGR
jgi:hypothetical protein